MAYIGLKQLDPVLTGSLQVSGSSGVTGSLDVDTNIVAGNRVTSGYGTVNYSLVVNEAGHGGGDLRVESADNAYQIFSDANQNKVGIGTNSLTSLLTVDGDVAATHVTASGNISSSGTITANQYGGDISGSSTSTGSFGKVEASRIRGGRLEINGATDYLDVAFDGSLFLVSAGDVAVVPGGGELTVDGNVVPDTDSADDLGSTSKYWRNAYIDSVTTTGNVSGSSISTGSFGYLNVAGNSNFIGDLTLGGNITIGDATSDSVTIAADFTSNLIPNANVTYDLGSSTKKWRDGFMASLVVSSSVSGSTAITANNITNGYPTSNPWGSSLEGSYFNNFDNTTHVSEILRFIAGAMSHSLDVADASANTKYWNTLSTSHTEGSTTSKNSLLDGVLGSTYENARLSQHWTSSAFIDFSTTGSYRSVQDYLTLKGWVLTSDRGDFGNDTGTNPFHGTYASRIPGTIQTNATFGTNSHTVTANAGGSSTVYSNSNYFGMGGLTSGGATAFYVRTIASHSFSDNYADSTPDEDSTFTTQSLADYSISSFGTSNGLVLAKIATAQPAVIPAAYQDGDFNSVVGPISGRFYTGGATSANSISASGYYATHEVVAGLKSGSMSDFQYKNGSDSNTRFYLYVGSLPSDITNSQPTAVVTSSAQITAFAATSRSFSGAPYLLTTTYTVTFDSEVSKSFDPCYGYSTAPLHNTNTTDTWENIGSTTLSNTTVTVNSSGVQSTSGTLYVTSADKSTNRADDSVPHRSDIAVASSSLSFTLDSNTENVGQNRTSNNTLNYSLVFRARSRNWKNTSVDSSSGTIYLYDAARFGQVAASGSIAVYSRAQGYDSNTLEDLTESFTGEDFRIVLADNVQAFNGAYFTTGTFQTNDEGDSVLGDYDLQVKPGYLVEPGGDYGYWFAEDFGSGTYKYYIRRFQKSSGTKTSMTVDVGKTLVNWNATTADSVAVAILFESSGNGSGNNVSLGTARIYDPSDLSSGVIETDVASDNFKNPFTTAIDLYGNTGGSKSSTEYTVPMRNVDGMYLDSNDNQLYVIIRYKGDPSPVTSITLSYS